MEKKILECVPNFSEGRDMSVIGQITDEIESVEGVKLLDVDPGKDTNRTVVTFVGDPDAVCEAAFRAVRKASELIDMSKHHGAHPRMGATDVCPFVPVSGITMEETVVYARKVAERIGNELNIPVYCYENAAFTEQRKNLADCRAGEYEGLEKKLSDPEWKPDFGPAGMNVRAGVTAVGARDFLVAFNVNLNTTSLRRANAIAFDVREKGRKVKNENGVETVIPGTLKNVKAIGWYIEEYGIAQISMNLTNISVTPVHEAFDEVCRKAGTRGVRVTGSELVGLIPLRSLLDAGRHYLTMQQRSSGVPDSELVKIAVRSLGLNDIRPFVPEEKIIELVMQDNDVKKLVNNDLRSFMEVTASEVPAPGGGSVSAYMGALGTALGTMVANLSAHKRGWDDRWKEFSDWAETGKKIQNLLLELVDDDTKAFNGILEAFRLPKNTGEDKALRHAAIQEATRNAVIVPFRVMETAFGAFPLIREMVMKGNPGSVTDAAVGALAVRSCIRGAFLNVRINISGLDDKKFAEEIVEEGAEIQRNAIREEQEILDLVDSYIMNQTS
ncbi:MAG TPA: glutamate formimidoyltransferase [Bacteroidales bacterium]|nr:glutamate formimidoyltransferase [Bacteroidales bacterium]HPF02683.1 glutamate formimidoyltransferase [Bacteroidales bacterium]HPJ58479.1 glutamate formimidoyltransferase [Bacteroidales bacterium]HPR11654.1 glutamate formimidoyltransferase [Bacteroidales bacterium]HRW85015.1 glutamate formimidoyltransferase [Bacteroidales bacterium]